MPGFRALLVALVLFFGAGVFVGCTGSEPPVAPTRYTVVRGDTLTRIARHHKVELSALRTANGISGDLIEVGQVLVIPGEGSVSTASEPSRRSRASGARQEPPTKATAAALRMPPLQACLAAPTLNGAAGEEPEMVASRGLTRAQIVTAMQQTLKQTRRCIPGAWPMGVIDLQIEVACTGRVARVSVSDSGGMDADLVACVKDTLRYTGFPAHDMPDGFSFGYPMRFEAG
jgi:hypothetical protein